MHCDCQVRLHCTRLGANASLVKFGECFRAILGVDVLTVLHKFEFTTALQFMHERMRLVSHRSFTKIGIFTVQV